MTDQWLSTIYFLLANPAGTHLHLLPSDTGYTLPHLTGEGFLIWDKVCLLEARLKETLGLEAWLLRQVAYQEDDQTHQSKAIYILELRQAPAGNWLPLEAIATLPLSDESHRPVLENYAHELLTRQIPRQRPAWLNPGWLPQAVSWIDEQLAGRELARSGEVAVIKRWCLSCILRVPVPAGDFYFKATVDLPLFVNEPILSDFLGQRYPQAVVRPVAIEPEKRWMLLPDFGPLIGWDVPAGAQEAMLRDFAALQQQAAQEPHTLRQMGCLDRGLPHLMAQIEPFFQELSQTNFLSPELMGQLWQRTNQLQAICQELGQFNIPHTLAHGDLHLGNVAGRGGQHTFFDWTDACLSHPFLDLLTIHTAKPPESKTHLRDFYLALWEEFETPERLQQAWNLAEPLCYLHQLISYFYIVVNVEPAGWGDLPGAIPSFAQKIVATLP